MVRLVPGVDPDGLNGSDRRQCDDEHVEHPSCVHGTSVDPMVTLWCEGDK